MSTLTGYANDRAVVWSGNCLHLMASLPEASVDAIVTDPPYGLGFMGKKWDDLPPGVEWAEACLRVLKPGGHLLAFGGSRTWHRLAVAIEDGGFEIRDSIAWLYGSGFPKSHDVSKAIDKHLGAEREKVRVDASQARNPKVTGGSKDGSVKWIAQAMEVGYHEKDGDTPATPEAERWQGWGTALKPAFEPIVVARKPLAKDVGGTVAGNVLEHGTGALNIDGCRIDMGSEYDPTKMQRQSVATAGMKGLGESGFKADHEQATYNAKGRWPANVVLDEDQAAELDQQSGVLKSGANPTRRGSDKFRDAYGEFVGQEECVAHRGADSGGASRFFYVAKAPAKERPRVDGIAHPTVKPLALMRWLVRLVTPPNGLVLDTFAGSGTTGEACLLEGFRCLLAERETPYLPLIAERLNRVSVEEIAS